MKRVCLVNGSPRGRRATSLVFLQELDRRLGAEGFRTTFVSVGIRDNRPAPAEVVEELAGADAIVFSFPLYVYTLPAALTQLMEDFYEETKQGRAVDRRTRTYAIVNCAYADPRVNAEALRVMRLFSRRAGLEWRFGVSIGGGLVVAATRSLPPVRWKLDRVYKLIRSDILGEATAACQDVSIKPIIPKAVMDWAKDSNWAKRFMARQPQD